MSGQDELLKELCGKCNGYSAKPANIEDLCSNPLEKYTYRKVEEAKMFAYGKAIEDCAENIHPIIAENTKQHYETGLRQAVKDSADNKDIDLPEALYEIFCSIQNQAIRNHEQKDRPELREKIEENALMCIVDAWLSSHSLKATRGEKLRLVDGIRNQFHSLIPDIEEEPEWAGARHLNLDSEIEEAKKQERKDIGEWLLDKDNMLSKDEKVCLLETLIAELVAGKALKGEKSEENPTK